MNAYAMQARHNIHLPIKYEYCFVLTIKRINVVDKDASFLRIYTLF